MSLKGIRTCKLGDAFIEKKADKINETLAHMGAPFYMVCSKLREKGSKDRYRIAWRRKSDKQCLDFAKYPNATATNEKTVRERLLKMFGVSLTKVENEPEAAKKIARGFLQKINDKELEKQKAKDKRIKDREERLQKSAKAKEEKAQKRAAGKKAKPVKEPKVKVPTRRELAAQKRDAAKQAKAAAAAVKKDVKANLNKVKDEKLTKTEVKKVLTETKKDVKETLIENTGIPAKQADIFANAVVQSIKPEIADGKISTADVNKAADKAEAKVEKVVEKAVETAMDADDKIGIENQASMKEFLAMMRG